MAEDNEAEGVGSRKSADGSQALRIASAGIRSMRNLSNFSLAIGVDILRGQVGEKESRAVLGSIRETRRNVQVGQQIGENKEVLDLQAASA